VVGRPEKTSRRLKRDKREQLFTSVTQNKSPTVSPLLSVSGLHPV